jgi:methionine-rich copper-binding protein CopC
MNRLTKLCRPIASALVLMLAAVPSALAHAHPMLMKPAPDSTGPVPSSISITFSEAVEPKFSSIQLTDEKGKPVDSEASRPKPNDPRTLILAVPKLTAGTYIVHWANVAVDGHRLEGSYKFTVQ